MFRYLLLTLVISCSAQGQFASLATSSDASRVYFVTSLRQKNTSQSTIGKIFVLDSTGLNLYLSNSRNLTGASISSDAKVFAASATLPCPGPTAGCSGAILRRTTITANGQNLDYLGDLHLSANGAWAFGIGSFSPTPLFTAYLVNVATGETTTAPFSQNVFQIATSGRTVANDGTAVYSDFNSIVVRHESDVRHIDAPTTGVPVTDAVTDAAASTVVFVTAGLSLRLADAIGSGSTQLASDGFAPSLSDDGKTLLYLSKRTGTTQVRIARLPSPALDRQLGFVVGGVTSATLSGDASTIYAVANDGRLLKIAASTGAAQELIPRTPHFTGASDFAPGKLVTLSGGGLTDLAFTADPPLPETINGTSTTIQGKKARLLSVAPDGILTIVPPDVTRTATPTETSSVEVVAPSSSPFESPGPLAVRISAFAPEFVLGFDSGLEGTGVGLILVAAHQDWSGLVTPASPARPGEYVHAYGFGLGPTSPAVPYGTAAPAREPLARLTSPFSCDPVEVTYQGLAPNFAGIFQFDFRVPLNTGSGFLFLRCTLSDAVIYGNVPVKR
jgi:uncharacterized protein (TIGR03437 family)